jgi:mannose/fructose/N-acetylgalactosamine-specific phosphotransferase system component IID
MSKAKNYQWTFWPFVFMFITTIGALVYKAIEAFFINFPDAVAKAEKAKVTVAQYQTAQIVIGLIAIVLIVAALFLAWDGVQAIRRLRAQVAAPAKAGGGE